MSDKMAQADWNDFLDDFLDGFPGIGEYHAKIKQLYTKLAQCRTELAAVGAALDVEKSAHRGSVLIADDVVNEMRQEVKQLQTDLKLNARMLADQCDQAREAENEATVLRRQLARMEAGRDFWRREYGRNVERLATLDAAEAALADAELAAYIHDKAGDELAQTVHTEQALRQEAEWSNDASRLVIDGAHEALDECQVPRDYGDGKSASIRVRVLWLNERTEKTEALAQLVTPELAALLDGLVALAESTDVQVPALLRSPMLRTIDEARELATHIKEALSDSQA